MSSCLWRPSYVSWTQREVLNPVFPWKVESTARTVLLAPAALTSCVPCCCWEGWGWVCAVGCAGMSKGTQRARAKELPRRLFPLHGFPRSTAFSWGPVCVVILKTCFGMLTSASWNDFLFAPLPRGFINIELHRKRILLLSDCSVVTFPQKHNGELYQCSVICFLLNTSD